MFILIVIPLNKVESFCRRSRDFYQIAKVVSTATGSLTIIGINYYLPRFRLMSELSYDIIVAVGHKGTRVGSIAVTPADKLIVLIMRNCSKNHLITAVKCTAVFLTLNITKSVNVHVPVQLITVTYGHKHGRQGNITIHHHVTLRIVVIRLVLPVVKLPTVRRLGNQVGSLARTVHTSADNLTAIGGANVSGQPVMLVIDKHGLQLIVTVHDEVTRVECIAVTPAQERIVLGGISQNANNATFIVLIYAQT